MATTTLGQRATVQGFGQTWARQVIELVGFFNALSAFFGGWALMWRPDGSILRMPIEQLQTSPFGDYFIPGAILFLVIGGTNFVAAFTALREKDSAWVWAGIAGVGLLIWCVSEVLMIRAFHPLQLVYFATGAAVALAAYRYRAAREFRPQKR